MNITISWSENLAHNYIKEEVPFEELYTLTWSDLNYTMGSFRGGHRNTQNWQQDNNALAFDIDYGLSLKKAIQIVKSKNIPALFATTKSHLKEKNNKIEERYRIIIPMASAFGQGSEVYKKYYVEACKFFLGYPDSACKDPSRFYYGNKDQIVHYIEGSIIPLWGWFRPVKTKSTSRVNKETVSDGGALINWVAKNIQEGNRNNALFWVYKTAQEKGLNAYEVTHAANNALTNPLSKKEVDIICRR